MSAMKKQFRELVNMFQNIENYVLAQWDNGRKAVTVEAVGMFCSRMNLNNLGYEVLGELIAQSEKIQVIGEEGAKVFIPRAIETTGAVKEN